MSVINIAETLIDASGINDPEPYLIIGEPRHGASTRLWLENIGSRSPIWTIRHSGVTHCSRQGAIALSFAYSMMAAKLRELNGE